LVLSLWIWPIKTLRVFLLSELLEQANKRAHGEGQASVVGDNQVDDSRDAEATRVVVWLLLTEGSWLHLLMLSTHPIVEEDAPRSTEDDVMVYDNDLE
jgi:hypothetical protein